MESPGEKLIIRLWDTLAVNGIGTLLKPWQMKREAAAHLEIRQRELLLLAQAEKDAEDIRAGRINFRDYMGGSKLLSHSKPDSRGDKRVEPTLDIANVIECVMHEMVGDNLRRSINVSNSVLYAEEELKGQESSLSDAMIDADWIHRWRDSVSNVSSEDMQRLWGRLLAEELTKPGAYSLRCMDFIKNLTRDEALLIERLSKVCFMEASGFWGDDNVLEEFGFSYQELMDLQHLGVVTGIEAENLNYTYSPRSEQETGIEVIFILSKDKCLQVSHETKRELSHKAYFATRLGMQLIRLSYLEPDMEFFKRFAETLVVQGFKVELADYVDVDDGNIKVYNLTDMVS